MRQYDDPEVAAAQQVGDAPHEAHDRRHHNAAEAPLEMHGPEQERLGKDREHCAPVPVPIQARELRYQEAAIDDLLGDGGGQWQQQGHQDGGTGITANKVVPRHVRFGQVEERHDKLRHQRLRGYERDQYPQNPERKCPPPPRSYQPKVRQ